MKLRSKTWKRIFMFKANNNKKKKKEIFILKQKENKTYINKQLEINICK